jgi:enoyl-CoA hydratase
MTESQTEKLILLELDPPFAVLTLNRPAENNAISIRLTEQLYDGLCIAEDNPQIKCVILRGAGKSFSVGADIRGDFSNVSAEEARKFSLRGGQVFSYVERFALPTISAIHGFCLGGGTELSLCCDFRIAHPRAMLGQPEIKLGLLPGWGGSQRLAKVVGKARAMEIVLTGENIPAGKALEWGLVNHVVGKSEDLLEAAKKFAGRFIGYPRAALSAAKRAVAVASDLPVQSGVLYENDLFGMLCNTPGYEEGKRALEENRKPRFKGI